jgi:cell division protein FtsW (lipid II flippase)
MQAIKTLMSLHERLESLLLFVLLAIILLAAIAIMVSPQFAEAMVILIILLAIAAIAKEISDR